MSDVFWTGFGHVLDMSWICAGHAWDIFRPGLGHGCDMFGKSSMFPKLSVSQKNMFTYQKTPNTQPNDGEVQGVNA